MKNTRWLTMALVGTVGISAGLLLSRNGLEAGSNDRHEDFIMVTGPILQPIAPNLNQNGSVPSATTPSAGTNLLGGFLGLFGGGATTVAGTAPTTANQLAQDAIQKQLDRVNQLSGTTTPNGLLSNMELDGVWLLDYRSGKLLATTLNRQNGKLSNWAEADLVEQFNLSPRSNVHFMMTVGNVYKGQSVLYLCETTSGKMGVYSMSLSDVVGIDPNARVSIHRHDMTSFRGPNMVRNNVPNGGVTQSGGINSWNSNGMSTTNMIEGNGNNTLKPLTPLPGNTPPPNPLEKAKPNVPNPFNKKD